MYLKIVSKFILLRILKGARPMFAIITIGLYSVNKNTYFQTMAQLSFHFWHLQMIISYSIKNVILSPSGIFTLSVKQYTQAI